MKLFDTYYKYIFLIGGFIWITACQSSGEIPKPQNLLDEHQMGIILGDFLLIENYNSQYVANHDSVNYDLLQLFSYPILNEKYQLTDSQAYHSYQYYLNFPDKMKNIISIAQDSLNQLVEKTTNEAKI